MSSPILEIDIVQIVNYDEEKFSNWFVRGFSALASKGAATKEIAFSPIHNIFSLRNSHIEALESIYHALPVNTQAQEYFRRGLVSAFERISTDTYIFTEQGGNIIRLCELILAPELAKRLLPVFANTGTSERNKSLIIGSLRYLSSLSNQQGISSIVLNLLTLPETSPQLSIFGWLTMCRCEPTEWSNYLSLLRDRITKTLSTCKCDNSDITAERFSAFMPLHEVAKQLTSLRYWRNSHKARYGDNWLIHALVGNDNSPYEVLQKDDGNLFLNFRNDPLNTPEPIDDSNVPDTDTILYLGRVAKYLEPDQPELCLFPRKDISDDLSSIKQWMIRLSPPSHRLAGACNG